SNMKVKGFSATDPHVPPSDPDYLFDRNTTLAILAGFAFNRRVMVQGYHGTGKSTHIEQVAARLNWPLVRVNLDAHASRIDLVGRDAKIGRAAWREMLHYSGMTVAISTKGALLAYEDDTQQ